jgi:dienelactone hydrolase
MLRIFATFLLTLFAFPAWGALKTKTVDYSYGGTPLKGYLAWDDSFKGRRPGVLVVHEFWGLNDYARSRADQLAKLGYVAFAADLYGGGKSSEHPDEAKAMMGAVRNNLQEWLGRAKAALQVLRGVDTVDPKRIAAIGYCFGGATVLQMALNGADVQAVASFHGGLFVPQSAKNVKAQILIFHGGNDVFVAPETLAGLKAKLDEAKVDYRVFVYPGAVHGFTVPGAEKRGMPNVAYNADADRKSWQEMLAAFQKLFSQPS